MWFFQKITFTMQETWPYTVAYQKFTWDYSKVWPVMMQINTLLKNDGIQTNQWIWIYYDDPKMVSWENLRSDVWYIIQEKDLNTMKSLKWKYQIKIIDKKSRLVSEFPYRNQLSILFGVKKIYPALTKYLSENNITGWTVMEIYDLTAKKIIYIININ
jgi:hypothetical protein